MTNNSQIENLRKKYKDNIISYDEIGMLFNAIDTIDRKIKQENIYKNVDVYIDRINSNLEDYIENERFNADIIYKNVDVEIKEKFFKIIPSDTDGDFLSIYSINSLGRIRICPNEDKIKSKYFTREQIEDTIHNSVSDYDCLKEGLYKMMYPEYYEKMRKENETK